MNLFRRNPSKRERKQRERKDASQKKNTEEQVKREVQRARLESQGLLPPRFDPAAARTPWPFKNEQAQPVGMKRFKSFGDRNRPQYTPKPEDPDAVTPLPPLPSSLPVNATPFNRVALSLPVKDAPSTPPVPQPDEKPKGLWDILSSPLARKKSTTEPNPRGGIKSTWVYHTLPRSWKGRHQPTSSSKAAGKLPASAVTTSDDNPFTDDHEDESSGSENPFTSADDTRYATLRRAGIPEDWARVGEGEREVKEGPVQRDRYSRYMADDDGYWIDPDNLDGPVLEQWALAHRTLVEGYDSRTSSRWKADPSEVR